MVKVAKVSWLFRHECQLTREVGIGDAFKMDAPTMDVLALEKIPSHLRCQVCDELLENAKVVHQCGHTFCDGCINAKTSCPTCHIRIPYGSLSPAIIVNKLVEEIRVRCVYGVSFHEDAEIYEALNDWDLCRCILPAKELARHAELCKYRPQECRYRSEGCDVVVRRKELAGHEEACGYAPKPCLTCGVKMQKKKLADHDKVCEDKVVDCRNAKYGCKEIVTRGYSTEHLRTCCMEPARDLLMEKDKKLEDLSKAKDGDQGAPGTSKRRAGKEQAGSAAAKKRRSVSSSSHLAESESCSSHQEESEESE